MPDWTRYLGGVVRNPQPALFVGDGTPGATETTVVAALDGIAIYEQSLPATPVLQATTSGNFCPLTIRYHSGTRTAFVNGAQVAATSGGAAASAQIPRWLGGPNGSVSGIGCLQGFVAEVLIFNRALSDPERILVETYFQLRYSAVPSSSSAVSSSSAAQWVSSYEPTPPEDSSSSLSSLPGGGYSSPSAPAQSSSQAPVAESSSAEPSLSSTSLAAPSSSSVSAESVPDSVPVTAGLEVWLRADRNVTYDTNERVSKWGDARGLPVAAAQSQAGLQPLWVTNALGSNDAIRFSGGSALALTPFDSGSGEFSIFVIAVPTAQSEVSDPPSPAGQPLLFGAGASNPQLIVAASAQGLNFYDSTGGQPFLGNLATATPALCPLTIRWNGGGVGEAHVNGSDDATDMSVSPAELMAAATVIGNALTAAGTNGFSGDIAEILIYNRAVTDAERLSIETYLQARYDCVPHSSYAGSPASSESYPLMVSSSSESSSSSSSYSYPGQFPPPPVIPSSSSSESSSSESSSSSSDATSSMSSEEILNVVSSISAGSPAPNPLKIMRGSTDITNQTISAMIGERINLNGVNGQGGDQWSIDGNIFSEFDASDSSGKVVTDVNTKQSTVSFCWISDGTFQVSYTANVNGVATSVSVTFTVKKPTVTFTLTFLGPVIADASSVRPNHGTTDSAVAFAADVEEPAGISGGQVEFIQLVNENWVWDRFGGGCACLTPNGQWQLDTNYPFSAARSAGPKIATSDGPSDPYLGVKYQSNYQNYTMYLMYRAKGGGEKDWVPLQYINWSWGYQVTKAAGAQGWTLVNPSTTPPAGTNGTPTTKHPQWTLNVVNKPIQNCPCP